MLNRFEFEDTDTMNASTLCILAGFAGALTIGATVARADAIDGGWCHADGRHMTIDGPAIVIPTGKQMTGRYDRHAFDYVVPAGEKNAGAAVAMILIDDDTLHLTIGGAMDAIQIWHRCTLPTS